MNINECIEQLNSLLEHIEKNSNVEIDYSWYELKEKIMKAGEK